MSEQKKNVFEVLAAINCNEHTEKKNGLTYLSWAWAWTECKKRFPLAYYTIYENEQGHPYFDDGRTAWVKTGVTIEGLHYGLKGGSLSAGFPLGVSNHFTGQPAKVSVENGSLLVLFERKNICYCEDLL